MIEEFQSASFTQLVSTSDIPHANRVLQCPLLIHSELAGLTLIVGSRDENNQSRMLLVELRAGRSHEWSVAMSKVILRATDIASDCVGVMPGDLAGISDQIILLGNAYFRAPDGHLQSVLFALDLDDVMSGRPQNAWRILKRSETSFQPSPGFAHIGDRSYVVHAPTYPDPGGGFPTAYSFEIQRVDDALLAQDAGRPLLGQGTDALAMAKFAQDPQHASRVWFSHRPVGGGYQLGRCLLDESGRATNVWWEHNGGLGPTPAGIEMLSYPEPLGDERLIASAGRFGDQGLVVIDVGRLSWTH